MQNRRLGPAFVPGSSERRGKGRPAPDQGSCSWVAGDWVGARRPEPGDNRDLVRQPPPAAGWPRPVKLQTEGLAMSRFFIHSPGVRRRHRIIIVAAAWLRQAPSPSPRIRRSAPQKTKQCPITTHLPGREPAGDAAKTRGRADRGSSSSGIERLSYFKLRLLPSNGSLSIT